MTEESKPERTDQQAFLGPFFLSRLTPLAEMRRAWLQNVDAEPPELLDFALASTYADCVQLGLRAQARACCGIPAGPDETCHGIR